MIKIIKKDTYSTYIEYISGLKIYYGRTIISASNTVNSYYEVNYPSEFSNIINLEVSVFRDTNVQNAQFKIDVIYGLTTKGFCFRDITRQAGAGYVVYYVLIGY